MKSRYVATLVLLAMLVVTAQGALVWWGNANQSPTGGDGDWGNPNNWGTVTLPVAGDEVGINSNGTPFPTLSTGDYSLSNLYDGYWGDAGMTMTGGSLAISNLMAVGYKGGNWQGPANNATFTMVDGYIGNPNSGLIPAQVWVGYSSDANYKINGTLDMTGGRIDARWAFNIGGGAGGTVGQVNLHGGVIHLWQILEIAPGSNLDLSGDGTFAIWNKWNGKSRTQIEAMIDAGLITGDGVVGNVLITEFDNGQTDGSVGFALTVAPEPGTLLLIGVGSLCCLKRRK